jgi:hypothetical protein
MRLAMPLFVVSALLFVFGLGFVVVGAREARRTPAPVDRSVAVTSVATVKQLMNTIATPASDAIFNSVQTNVTDKGTEEIAPKDDQEWDALGGMAATLAELGNLLLADGRAVDRGDWVKMSQAMTVAAKQAADAAAARNKDGILDAGSAVNLTCDNCHMRYRRQ